MSIEAHPRRRRRPALIVLVIIAACGCLALGWWQWTRFQAASGTFQNLGYALQWPLFAWFCVYAYRNFVRYEEAAPEPRKSGEVTEIPAGLLPERPEPAPQPTDDPALQEYNAYLAELAKIDAELAKNDAELAKNDAELAKNDAELAKTDAEKQNRTTA